jgi:hypothetical protein
MPLVNYREQWDFLKSTDLERWVTTADSDWGEGYSKCHLELSQSGSAALFHGELNTRPPQDGRTFKAGYVNMATVKQRGFMNCLKE